MQWLFGPLTRMLDIPMSEFSAWKSPQRPLLAADNSFAVSICFEDAFPNEIRGQVAMAGVLVNVSEDIWFGDSLAPHQRLQMARFRARESERPMIRSSNNGLSSLINWKGGLDQYAPQFRKHVVNGLVQPREGVTPYIAFGDSPVVSLAGLFLVLGLLFGKLPLANRR
jgi:apolipoprotein N-acyltransferase